MAIHLLLRGKTTCCSFLCFQVNFKKIIFYFKHDADLVQRQVFVITYLFFPQNVLYELKATWQEQKQHRVPHCVQWLHWHKYSKPPIVWVFQKWMNVLWNRLSFFLFSFHLTPLCCHQRCLFFLTILAFLLENAQ